MNATDEVRALFAGADPAADHVARPRVTAAELIDRAENEPHPAGVSRRNALVAAGIVVGAVGVTTAFPLAAGLSERAGEVALPDAGPVVMPLLLQPREEPPAAAGPLRALARQIGAARSDGRTGRYAFHHTKDWGMVQATSEGHVMSYVQENRSWVAADGSGISRTTQLGPQFPDSASERYWRKKLAAWTPDPARTTDSPGTDVIPTAARRPPAPADRAGLADALHLDAGGAATAKAVVTLHGSYVLTRAQRATLLELLADARGFEWRGEVTDRAGRAGVAITNDDRRHDLRSVLVFDPRTGELLSFEFGSPKVSRVNAYWLLLETDWRDQVG